MDFAEAIRGIFGGQSPQSPPSGDDYAAPLRPMVDAGAEVRRKPRLSFDLYPPKSDHDPVLGEELHDILRSKDKVPSPDFIAPPPGLGQAPNRVPSDMQYERPPNVLSENAARGISAGAVEPFGQAGRLATGGSEDVAGDLAGVGAAVAPIPGAGVSRAVKAGLEGTERAATGHIGDMIRAFHGSPHDFERFDLGKIGTGEGAQAYGHGLYFAENEGVAKQYAKDLAYPVGDPRRLAAERLEQHGDRAKAIEALQKTHDYLKDQPPPSHGFPRLSSGTVSEAIQLLKSNWEPTAGHRYEVGIRANPEHFLDWDKPLSEQHPKVQEALAGLGIKHDKEASRAYDDALLEALQSEGPSKPLPKQPRNPTGGEILESRSLVPGAYNDRTAASIKLREAGIPGIKYLDQGSRGKGDGTRNFVVFDDKLIDILKKYGIAGIGALPAMNAFHYQDKQ